MRKLKPFKEYSIKELKALWKHYLSSRGYQRSEKGPNYLSVGQRERMLSTLFDKIKDMEHGN